MGKIMHSKLKTLNLIAAFNCLLQNSSCFVRRSTALLGLVPMRACLRAFKIGKRGVLSLSYFSVFIPLINSLPYAIFKTKHCT